MAGFELVPGSAARHGTERAARLVGLLTRDRVPSVREVSAVLREFGELAPVLNAEDVTEMRQAAIELWTVFATTEVAEAARRLNELLAAHATAPRLTTHDGGWPWHLHVDSADDGPWGEWLRTSSCLAMAVLLADRQALPGGICAAPSCRAPFAHTGGGSPRRYCGSRCATRERVAAHRKTRQ